MRPGKKRGAWAEVCGEAVLVDGAETVCVPLHLTRLDPSPEGRPVRWVNPAALWWASDRQLHAALCAWGRPAPARAVAEVVSRLHRLGWQLRAEFRRGLRA